MEKNSTYLLLALFAIAFVLVFALFGGFVIAMGLVFVAILVVFLTELRKEPFGPVRSHSEIAKDRRFEIKKGQTVYLKNYDINVKFLRVEKQKLSVNAYPPKILKLLVYRENHGKTLSFDVNNLHSSRVGSALGREFHFLDFRRDRAIISVK